MNRRLIASVGAIASLGLVLSGCAGGSDSTSSETTEAATSEETAEESAAEEAATVCEGAIAVMAPLTGGAASIGQEQLNFAKLAVEDFNAANGSSYTLGESDTQLDAGQASTQATSIISDSSIMVTNYMKKND